MSGAEWSYASRDVHQAVIATAFVGAHHELLNEKASPEQRVLLVAALVDLLQRWDVQPKEYTGDNPHPQDYSALKAERDHRKETMKRVAKEIRECNRNSDKTGNRTLIEAVSPWTEHWADLLDPEGKT